jgi:hypothetical protein
LFFALASGEEGYTIPGGRQGLGLIFGSGDETSPGTRQGASTVIYRLEKNEN